MSDFAYLFSFIVDIINYFEYRHNKQYKKIINNEDKYKECLINYLNNLFEKDINNNKIKPFNELFENYNIEDRFEFIKKIKPTFYNKLKNAYLGINSYRHDINIQEVYKKKIKRKFHRKYKGKPNLTTMYYERDIFEYITSDSYINIYLDYYIIKDNLNLFECILKLIKYFNDNNYIEIKIYYGLDIYKKLNIIQNNNLNIKKDFLMFNSNIDNSNNDSDDDSYFSEDYYTDDYDYSYSYDNSDDEDENDEDENDEDENDEDEEDDNDEDDNEDEE